MDTHKLKQKLQDRAVVAKYLGMLNKDIYLVYIREKKSIKRIKKSEFLLKLDTTERQNAEKNSPAMLTNSNEDLDPFPSDKPIP